MSDKNDTTLEQLEIELQTAKAEIKAAKNRYSTIEAQINAVHEQRCGLRHNDKLISTPEFVEHLMSRNWHRDDVADFSAGEVLMVSGIDRRDYTIGVILVHRCLGTGNIPLDIAHRMRQAWLEKNGGAE